MLSKIIPSDPFGEDKQMAIVQNNLLGSTVEGCRVVLKNTQTQLSDLIRRVHEQPYSTRQIASEGATDHGQRTRQAITIDNTILAQAQRQSGGCIGRDQGKSR